MWVKSKEFKKILGLSNQALNERRKKGSIKYKIINNVYFYWLEESIETNVNRYNIIYCRVSNTKQKDDLDKQEQILKEYAISNGYKIDYVFKDIASGMNENRKGLNEMIELVYKNKINKIFISYKDTLFLAFGFKSINIALLSKSIFGKSVSIFIFHLYPSFSSF